MKLTESTFLLFAAKHYDNPQCEGESEFHDDMKRFKYIKRLLRKYQDSGELKERLILNHLIVVFNIFGAEAGSTLLLFKLEPEFWSILKTFMVFLNMLPDGELEEIDELEEIKKGDVVYISANAKHALKNNGKETLEFYWIFPTDRFSEVKYLS